MADNSRLVNLPSDPSPDPSGVGTALFQQFEDLRKQKLAQESEAVTEGLRHKYRTAEVDQQGRLNQMLEALRHGNRIAETDIAYTRSQQAGRESLAATLGFAEDAAMKGIQNPLATVETSPILGEGPLVRRRSDLGPGAAPVAQDVLMQSLREHGAKQQALAQGEAAQGTALLKHELDQMPPDVTIRIKAAMDQATGRGDHLTALMLAPFATPGASMQGFEKVMPALQRLEAASARDRTLIAIGQEQTARALAVARLKGDIDKLRISASTGKFNARMYDKSAEQVRMHLNESRRRQGQLRDEMMLSSDEGQIQRARRLYDAEMMRYQELTDQLTSLENLQQQAAQKAAQDAGAPTAPTSKSPVVPSPTPEPSGGGDILGVRPRGR